MQPGEITRTGFSQALLFACLLLLALISLLDQFFWQALACMLAAGSLALLTWKPHPSWRYRLFGLYTLSSLLAFIQAADNANPLALTPHMAYALLAFSLLPLRIALVAATSFTLLISLLLLLLVREQASFYLILFWLPLLLSASYSLFNEYRLFYFYHHQTSNNHLDLPDLRRSHKHLQKELQRQQREKTSLALLLLSRPTNQPAFEPTDVTHVRQLLAGFETLYYLTSHALCIVFPFTHEEQLVHKLNQLQHALPRMRMDHLEVQPGTSPEQLLPDLRQLLQAQEDA